MAERILRQEDLEKKTGLARSTLNRLEKRGDFPERVRIASRFVGWFESEVDEWLRSRPRGPARFYSRGGGKSAA